MTDTPDWYAKAWAGISESARDELRDLADERANGERGKPSPDLVAEIQAADGIVMHAGFAGSEPDDWVTVVPTPFLTWVLEQE